VIADITFNEVDSLASQILQARERFAAAVTQVIEDQHLLTGVNQGQGGMRADVSGPAGNQRGFVHDEAFLSQGNCASQENVGRVGERLSGASSQRVVKTDLNSCSQRGCITLYATA